MTEDLRQPVPTLEDVARVAGVSRATVSRVINGKRKVAAAVQETVLAAVAETGYVPNRAARSLVTRRTGMAAVVVSGSAAGPGEEADPSRALSDPFFGRVVGGFVRALRRHDVHPVLLFADTPEAEDQAVNYLRLGNVDGTLLVSTHGDDPLPGRLVEAGRPVVMFSRPARPVPVSYVDLANSDGGRLAAEHLVARGCTSLGLVSGPLDVPAARDRADGFRDRAARHGHAYVPGAADDFTFAGGEAATERLLAEVPGIDGVFAGNDLMAQGALHALRTHGRRVPDDVAVVGFDDSPVATQTRPHLTTVRQPAEEMAATMADLLVERIEDPGLPPRSVVFDPELVLRDSA
ncbi:LacI family DNA-binding transcriptional regulator [Myceligenerans salitolerans]|uniref:LacI family DNA-binding transcriptional regulator n=1 Tax=Myceligenerans salitolerans TaxID=1230528 RepID=A0ABS3IDS8_9MICO|nr:LacI family DNA-binding transcriptional regulator [Myceligenerans salitolerans]MBO0610573.1 LacI family DNA-binding transcriptional regulator [Myceligenerans salitolerans]